MEALAVALICLAFWSVRNSTIKDFDKKFDDLQAKITTIANHVNTLQHDVGYLMDIEARRTE